MREARQDHGVNGYAADVLKAVGIDGRDRSTWRVRAIVQAFLDNVRAISIYSPDPTGTEMIVSAAGQLCLRPGLCIRKGDCDDLSVLLGSLCLCVGLQVRILKQSWGGGQQEHVLIAVLDEHNVWLKADPSHASLPVGQGVPANEEQMYDPLDAVGAIGTSGPELVTFGALPTVGGVRSPAPMKKLRYQINDQLTPRAPAGLGAFVSDDQLLASIQQTTALMDATDAAVKGCSPPSTPSMASTDVTVWNGVYSGYKTMIAALNECLDDDLPSIHTACTSFYTLSNHWAPAQSMLLGYQATATATQKTVAAACPNFTPTPAPPVPQPLPPGPSQGPAGGWLGDVETAGKVVGGTVLVLVLGYAGYKAIQVGSSFAKKK